MMSPAVNVDFAVVLEKAATSLDPAVRGAAIRYKRMEKELEAIRSFFALYDEAHREADAEARQPAATAAQRKARAANGGGGGGGRGNEEFVARVRQMLLDHGQPMQMLRLYDAYYAKYSDRAAPSSESFRKKLFACREHIALHPGAGYWPAGAELPAADVEQLHAA